MPEASSASASPGLTSRRRAGCGREGVELRTNAGRLRACSKATPHGRERACFQYWLGVARAHAALGLPPAPPVSQAVLLRRMHWMTSAFPKGQVKGHPWTCQGFKGWPAGGLLRWRRAEIVGG
ncbi:unnamed protein product [Prorocentrum cordatum]|uniref:Sulfhydryl oxidase n=1 Tax=Prorocentrum cordatum TaxID=2364126 RepID=A0ABN9RRW6_9DINO|nr:unnamed protein product [Polarella glacialis]